MRWLRAILPGLTCCLVSASPYASCISGSDVSEPGDTSGGDHLRLRLENAIRRALTFDPHVGQSAAEFRAYAARVGIAQASYWPSVNASTDVSYVRNALPMSGDGSGDNGAGIAGRGRVNLSWLLFDAGTRDSLLEQARRRLEMTKALGDARLQQVIFDVVGAYYATVDAQSKFRAAQAVEDVAQQSLRVACARFDAGAGALADVLRARTAYERQVLSRLDVAAAVAARSGELAVLVGAPMDTTFSLDDDNGDDLTAPPPLAPAEVLLAELRLHHPLLRKAQSEVLAAVAGRRAIEGSWGPSLSLMADVSRGVPSGSSLSLGVQISIPLYDGGFQRYRTREANALVDLANAGRFAAELSVVSRVWQSHRALRALAQRRVVEMRLYSDAMQSYEMARGRYREGVGSIEELISAQSAWADAEYMLMRSRARWHLARLTLLASLGHLDADGISALARRNPRKPVSLVIPPASPPLRDPENGTGAHRRNTRR